MSWWVIGCEAVAFAAVFTAVVFATYAGKRKYSAAAIHNYPPDIQEEFFKTHPRLDTSATSGSVILAKACGVLLFSAILVGCAWLAGARTFWQGAALAFGLMVWIGLYDTLFLDWVLFANMRVFRLEGTEHMDEAYHQKWFHLKGMLFPGLIFALVPAAVVGFAITLLA